MYHYRVHNINQFGYDVSFVTFTMQFVSIFEVLFSHGIADRYLRYGENVHEIFYKVRSVHSGEKNRKSVNI